MISDRTKANPKLSLRDQLNRVSLKLNEGNQSPENRKNPETFKSNQTESQSQEARLERAVISLIGVFNHNLIPEFKSPNVKNTLVLKADKANLEKEQVKNGEKEATEQADFTMHFMSQVKKLNLPQYSPYNDKVIKQCLLKYCPEKFISDHELSECFKLLDTTLGCIKSGKILDLTRMTINKYSVAQQLLVYSLYLGSDFTILPNYKLISNSKRKVDTYEFKKCVRFKVSDFMGHSYGNGKYIPPHTHLGVVDNENNETEGHFYLK